RHGQRQTQRWFETLWPGRWRQIYGVQHALMPDYHGPYIPIWQHLQALDGDLRVYQIDGRDRRFATQLDPQGKPITITTLVLDQQPQSVVLRPTAAGSWAMTTPQGMTLGELAPTDDRLPGPATSDHWYYEYYLFEAFAPTVPSAP
ncbi:MAG TPA: hypothetical protein V6D02_11925, partial [Candidatus Obscuribacterales bacterium]